MLAAAHESSCYLLILFQVREHAEHPLEYVLFCNYCTVLMSESRYLRRRLHCLVVGDPSALYLISEQHHIQVLSSFSLLANTNPQHPCVSKGPSYSTKKPVVFHMFSVVRLGYRRKKGFGDEGVLTKLPRVKIEDEVRAKSSLKNL